MERAASVVSLVIGTRECPLLAQSGLKRTFAVGPPTSAYDPKRTSFLLLSMAFEQSNSYIDRDTLSTDRVWHLDRSKTGSKNSCGRPSRMA
jgi:hypothetical protein